MAYEDLTFSGYGPTTIDRYEAEKEAIQNKKEVS